TARFRRTARLIFAPPGSYGGGVLGAATVAVQTGMAHRPETQGQSVAHVEPGIEVPAIDDGQSEAARRHGMGLGRLVVVERDLDARDLGILGDQLGDNAPLDRIVDAVCAEQDNAVPRAAILVGEAPPAV